MLNNPKSIERIKEIMTENKTDRGKPFKAADLHRKTGISEKHLSNILTDNKRLTPGTAAKIIKAFPGRYYRLQWLMGEDDYKTEGAMFDAEWKETVRKLNEGSKNQNAIYKAVATMMQLYGVEWDGGTTPTYIVICNDLGCVGLRVLHPDAVQRTDCRT